MLRSVYYDVFYSLFSESEDNCGPSLLPKEQAKAYKISFYEALMHDKWED